MHNNSQLLIKQDDYTLKIIVKTTPVNATWSL